MRRLTIEAQSSSLQSQMSIRDCFKGSMVQFHDRDMLVSSELVCSLLHKIYNVAESERWKFWQVLFSFEESQEVLQLAWFV